MKTITIHQPEHLPYPGFISKILLSDIYVILDDVQFRKNYYQNRNKLIDIEGREYSSTVPIKK